MNEIADQQIEAAGLAMLNLDRTFKHKDDAFRHARAALAAAQTAGERTAAQMNDPLVARVSVGKDASMVSPVSIEWHLRYGKPYEVRYVAAEVVANFDYLINHCSRDEAWRRLKLLRSVSKQWRHR